MKPQDYEFISASEIADYLYCQRSWWLRKSDKAKPQTGAMTQGTETHKAYAQQLKTVQRYQFIGQLIVSLGVILLIILVILRLLGV